MSPEGRRLARVLDGLAELHGEPKTGARADPYAMLVAANCGYPASDAACAKGLAALKKSVGVAPAAILGATKRQLVEAMLAGGIVPALRAERLRAIARAVVDDHGGDLRRALVAAGPRARRILKTFPTIADAGAEKILLFARLEHVMAVPSNATQVPLRLGFGRDSKSWAAGYRSAQQALAALVEEDYAPRARVHLLLKKHGETVCKRAAPRCEVCPATKDCAYYAGRR
jgi:endonuclease III